MNEAEALKRDWETNPRWKGIQRTYKADTVLKLRGSIQVAYTLACLGTERFYYLVKNRPYVQALGAMSGNQSVEYVYGGQEVVYQSGWGIAADANLDGRTLTDQTRYSVKSILDLLRRINNAFKLEDRKQQLKGNGTKYWFAPIVADAEAGFGGKLNVNDLMEAMIEGGAAAVHFEDQVSSEKKCGHLGGKVLVPTSEFVQKLNEARLAADILGVPTVIIARTDARDAHLITSDVDERDRPFLTGEEKTSEGFYRMRGGMGMVITRALAYAPYADFLWFETNKPDLAEAKRFAEAVHAKYPGKLFAYNLSPSFNWLLNFAKKVLAELTNDKVQKMLAFIPNEILVDKSKSSEEKLLWNPDFKALVDKEIAEFQPKLGKMGYKFQFVTLAGFHALNLASFKLARGFAQRGMPAYVELQQEEFAAEKDGYPAAKHQEFVGTAYADAVVQAVSGGESSTSAMKGSTEEEQFNPRTK